MAEISTPSMPAHAEVATSSPGPLTLAFVRQFARAYRPECGGLIMN